MASRSRSLLRFFSSFNNITTLHESTVYRRSMLRPPSMASHRNLRHNSCSFIGTLVSRVRRSGNWIRGLRVFAFLKVESNPRLKNSSNFCVCLRMQGKLAEISLQHLKLNDFIYVSGPLGSYVKLNASGQPQIIYKVFVQDLNYVSRLDQHRTALSSAAPNAGNISSSSTGKIVEEQEIERLHLWQLFFANPDEWWDNRHRSNKNPNSPDFKHKDTGECLWLSHSDPLWITEQLQLYDSAAYNRVFYKRINCSEKGWNWNAVMEHSCEVN